MTDGWASIDDVLFEALRYEEVLGIVAVSREGLVVGSAGVARSDAELVGALGASLVGAADRTARRLGAGRASDLSVTTADGMFHVRSGDEFAVLLFTEPCDAGAACRVCGEAAEKLTAVLAGI